MKSYLNIAVLGLLLALAMPTFSQVSIGVGIRIGPPPPRHEVMVARPFPDAVWIAGYYRWAPRHHHYVWVRGHWVRAPRRHVIWVPATWEQRKGEWVYHEGRWQDEKRAPEERRVRREGEHR